MKKLAFITTLFILNIVSLYAVAGPGEPGSGDCGPTDPNAGPDCVPSPLDSWVIFLAAVALIFTTIYLLRKQKAAINAA